MYRIWTITCCLLLLSACEGPNTNSPASPEGSGPAVDSPALAEVNGTPISRAMLDAYLQARGAPAATPQQKQAALNDLIKLTLLKQQAEKTGLTDNPELRAALHLERVNSIASAMARKYTSEHVVTDAEVRAIYDDRIKQVGTREYKLRHILLSSKQEALQVVEQLNHGAGFAQLANEVSLDTRSAAGGSLGWVNLAQLPPPLAAKVREMETGRYTQQPVQSPYGWHIIKLEDTREFTPPAFEQVKGGIIAAQQRQLIEQFVSQLRADSQVSVMANFGAETGPNPQPATQPSESASPEG